MSVPRIFSDAPSPWASAVSKKVDAGFADSMEHFYRRLLVCIGAKGHRAEAEQGHLYAS
jgi:hypothetical protein